MDKLHISVPRPRTLRTAVAGIVAAAVLLAGCGGGAPKQAAPGQSGQQGSGAPAQQQQPQQQGGLPRKETLYKAGFQWGPPANFNPLSPSAAWPVPQELLIYETLFAFNLLSGKLDPVLGQSYKWDNQVATVTLQPGTKWQDGQPLTADDVIYTFELAKRVTVSYSPFWDYVTKIEKVDDRNIRFHLNPDKPNRGLVENYFATVRILPKHIWSKLESEGKNLLQEKNDQPVGSGPYKLKTASPEQIILERDDNYWGKSVYGTPAPRYVVHPIFKSNDAGNLALQQNQIDLSQQFVPQVWKMWEDQKLPVKTWFKQPPYHIPASIPSLHINLQKAPLNNPKVRRALAYAIDYKKIAEVAMSRYSATAISSLLIPGSPLEQKYLDENDVKQFGWEYNPQKAVEILEKELGAKKGPDGIYVLPDGTRLGPFKAECPYGWTDWMTALEIVAQSARAVGIDVKTEFPEQPVWLDHRNTGNFDLLLNTPAGGYSPAHPWLRFRDVMESRGVPEVGKVAYWNFNRYSNPKVGPLLDQAIRTTDEQQLASIYKELNRIFMTDIPVIPLMYRPWEFYTVNETYWTNFPSSDNPVAPPQHNHAGIRTYFVIKPKQ